MDQKEYLFYKTTDTYDSAKELLKTLLPIVGDVESILDFGCGVGSWAKAFQESGVKNCFLIDHPSIDVSKLLIRSDFTFVPANLDKFLPDVIKVDCVVSTEVLEHISDYRSDQIIDYLTKCSDLIIFSAAIPRQGGLGHCNEQRHAYWHQKFYERGFCFYDGFKTEVLDNDRIVYWLRQNLFIYYNDKSKKRESFNKRNNITNGNFEIVSSYVLNKPFGIKESAILLYKAIIFKIRRYIE